MRRDVLVTTATIMPLRECIQRELTKRQNFKSRFSLQYVAGNRVPVSLSSFFRVCCRGYMHVAICTCSCARVMLPYPSHTYDTPCHLRFFSKWKCTRTRTYVHTPRANILCARPSDEMDTWSRRGGLHRKVIRCFYSGSAKSEPIPVALSV